MTANIFALIKSVTLRCFWEFWESHGFYLNSREGMARACLSGGLLRLCLPHWIMSQMTWFFPWPHHLWDACLSVSHVTPLDVLSALIGANNLLPADITASGKVKWDHACAEDTKWRHHNVLMNINWLPQMKALLGLALVLGIEWMLGGINFWYVCC